MVTKTATKTLTCSFGAFANRIRTNPGTKLGAIHLGNPGFAPEVIDDLIGLDSEKRLIVGQIGFKRLAIEDTLTDQATRK
jgi:hypothetical protein